MQSITRVLAKNTLWQLGGKAIGMILGVAAVAIMTRMLGPEGYGYYTTITAYLALFGIATDFGLNVFVVQMLSERELSKQEERRLASVFFTLRVLLALIILGASVLVMWFLPYPAAVRGGVWILAISFWLIVAHQILVGIFQTKLAMGRVAAAEIISRTVLLAGVALAWQYGLGLAGVFWAVVAGNVFNFGLSWLWLKPFVPVWFVWDWILARRILLRSWPVALSVILNVVYLRADVLILAWYRSAAEVGLYGAPYRVIDILVVFPTMFVGLVLPFLSRSYAAGDQAQFQTMFQRAFDSLVLMVLPLIVGALLLGREIMEFLAGADFAASAPLLHILILATFFIYLGNLFTHSVVAVGRQKSMIFGYAFVAVVTVVGYLFFIPRFGAMAAAILTVLSEAMACWIAAWIVRRASGATISWHRTLRGVAAALGMAVLVWLVRPFGLWPALLMGIMSYSCLLVVTAAVPKRFLYQKLNSKKQIYISNIKN